MEGTRESLPRVHDLQHPRLGKPRRGLQIMDTRMGFLCTFHNVVIDSIILLPWTELSQKYLREDKSVFKGVGVVVVQESIYDVTA